LLEFNGQLYASTYNKAEGGEIWRSSNGLNWSRVARQGFGVPTNSEIFRFAVFSDTLYASTWSYTTAHGAEIWRSSTGISGDWTRVVTNGFGDANNGGVLSFEVFNGYLYAGTRNLTTGPEVWRTNNGTSWVQVNADGFGDTNNSGLSAFTTFHGYLYASTSHKTAATGTQIWRCQACDGSDWTRVVDSGFGNVNTRTWSALEVFDGYLYCVAGNWITGMEVWRTTDGTNWVQVEFAGFGDSNNGAPYLDSAVTVFNNRLFIGTWNDANGGEVWRKTVVTADFTASPTSGPAPLAVTFTNTSTGEYITSRWNFGDGVTSTLTNPTHTYTTAGSYTVTLTVGDGVDSNTVTRTNYIAVYTPVQVDFTASPTSGIAPLTVVFTNTSTGDYTTSLWDFGDGITSTLTSPTHTYTAAGVYTVTLTASGPGGSDTEVKAGYITVRYSVYLPLIMRQYNYP
jgi:PKD repeat protein